MDVIEEWINRDEWKDGRRVVERGMEESIKGEWVTNKLSWCCCDVVLVLL